MRSDTESFIDLLKNKTMYPILKNCTQNETIKNVLSVLEESVKNNETLINNIDGAIKFKDNSSKTIFHHIENIMQ